MALTGADLAPAEVSDKSWVLMFSGAAVSFFAQTLVIMSLQRLEAGPVNVLATLEIVFSFTWQTTLLGTSSHLTSVLGVLVIVSCAILVSAQKMLSGNKNGSAKVGDDQWSEHGTLPSDAGTDQHSANDADSDEKASKEQMGALTLLEEGAVRSESVK
eukprot:CAMPEP_0119423218 /NCGR_PEP_ID=MMETSP1335-20130426/29789_1 /TAXON_ID=259385 /ORGANISM="Chrysoculter rhomboideus, Strain RCC1486" /LENGTH=157 /DNA_ID=CAMNT_0007448699 /DNA_START=62 /DNA_END=535 /DNA_ORIENTATION=+